MKARFWILIAVAAVLAIYYATRPAAPAVEEVDIEQNADSEEMRRLRELKTLLEDRLLPGEEPPEPDDLSIRVEVDPTSAKNQLYYYISEAHGYYVETFRIEFYYKPDETTTKESSPVRVIKYVNDYLKANETFRGCVTLMPPELLGVGGDLGDSDNWDADILSWGRARMQNPDPLPPLSEVGKCR